MEHVEELQKKVEAKDDLLFKHDFFSLTVFAHLKQNYDLPSEHNLPNDHHHSGGWGLRKEKQAQMLFSNSIISLMVISMVGCMLY